MPDRATQHYAAIRPHAPYVGNPAEFRIGLRPIAVEAWFEGGEAEPAARKDALLARAPELVWKATAGSEPGQCEALELVADWLGIEVTRDARPPLQAAARLVADDLCLMQLRDGAWTLTAASLCAGSFFTARDAVGKALDRLHAPVTGFAERLLPRVTRIFDTLRPDVVLERRNWTVVNSADLHLPNPAPVRARLPAITPDEAGDALNLRMERQTLRRLPRTGAMLFSIRVWRHSLSELAAHPARLDAFTRAWEAVMGAGGEDFRTYKRLDIYDPLVRGFLRSAAASDAP